jgi:hypothetical protein
MVEKYRIDDKGRECSGCKEYKLWEEFHDARPPKCKICTRKRDTERSRANGVKEKDRYIVDGEGRECTICRKYKEWDEFGSKKLGVRGYSNKCKVCTREQDNDRNRAKGMKERKKYRIDDKGRECSKCGKYKLWEEFNDCKPTECKECISKTYQENKETVAERHKEYRNNHTDSIREYQEVYRKNNKELIQENSRKYYQDNIENFKESNTKYYAENKDKVIEINTKYYAENKDKMLEKKNQYQKERRKNDPEFKILLNTRGRIGMALKAQNAYKNFRTIDILGCSPAKYRKYLENQWYNNMTWKTNTRDGWQVHHTIPIYMFNLTDPEQYMQCFHYTNTQPLWKEDHEEAHRLLRAITN